MKVLHTADWHLGQRFQGEERTDEHRHFLFEQLLPLIQAEAVDALVIAGDVFDTGSPSNAALDLYYSFLATLRHSPCRHVVVVGGNHDSPATLQAPQQALRHLGVTVVADLPAAPADQIILLTDPAGQPALVVVAVPYLRERHLGLTTMGRTADDIAAQVRAGIARHYAAVAALAAPHRAAGLPVLATGHLFAAGLTCTEGCATFRWATWDRLRPTASPKPSITWRWGTFTSHRRWAGKRASATPARRWRWRSMRLICRAGWWCSHSAARPAPP